MTAGYSGTPLDRKLGVTAESVLVILDDPGHLLELLDLPPGVDVRTTARGKADVVVCFVSTRARLKARTPTLGRMIHPDGTAWVCWPKRSSGVATDVTENVVREVVLPTGLVDVKVAAIDDTWSGLKLVWRKERR